MRLYDAGSEELDCREEKQRTQQRSLQTLFMSKMLGKCHYFEEDLHCLSFWSGRFHLGEYQAVNMGYLWPAKQTWPAVNGQYSCWKKKMSCFFLTFRPPPCSKEYLSSSKPISPKTKYQVTQLHINDLFKDGNQTCTLRNELRIDWNTGYAWLWSIALIIW